MYDEIVLFFLRKIPKNKAYRSKILDALMLQFDSWAACRKIYFLTITNVQPSRKRKDKQHRIIRSISIRPFYMLYNG